MSLKPQSADGSYLMVSSWPDLICGLTPECRDEITWSGTLGSLDELVFFVVPLRNFASRPALRKTASASRDDRPRASLTTPSDRRVPDLESATGHGIPWR